jgi:hypothetical protein
VQKNTNDNFVYEDYSLGEGLGEVINRQLRKDKGILKIN